MTARDSAPSPTSSLRHKAASNASVAARLPAWLKAANRATVARALNRLERKLLA